MAFLIRFLTRGVGTSGGAGGRLSALPRAVAMLITVFAFTSGALSQAQFPDEYQVKAAFLYNFAKFIEWPAGAFANPNDPLLFCIYGYDPFGSDLDRAIMGKVIGSRPVAVNRVSSSDGLRSCHLLFVAASETRHLPQIRESLRGSSAVLVGESEGFLSKGGVINLFLEDNRVQFEINLVEAQRAQVNINARLLRLARVVRNAMTGGEN